ncbi:MAG: hypothetical protein II998_08140 [Clostridia bacterium]|nr:hypothetical protein [Clostridia bacterium]
MSFKLLSMLTSLFILVFPVSASANAHAGEGVGIFRVSTQTEDDIFGAAGDTIEYKVFTEANTIGQGEFVAGAYVYNDSLTNGDCVEMNIIIVEYSQSEGNKIPEVIHLKTIHACPGDNGKFVCTDPFELDSSTTAVKAMIWGKEKIIPYAPSADYTK